MFSNAFPYGIEIFQYPYPAQYAQNVNAQQQEAIFQLSMAAQQQSQLSYRAGLQNVYTIPEDPWETDYKAALKELDELFPNLEVPK